jgi:ssDNA-binding Zn-finger/Zn-ribbon topoisomerase 1
MADPAFYRCPDCHGDLFVVAPSRYGWSVVCRACANCYGFDPQGLIYLIRRGIHDTRALFSNAGLRATET